MPRLTISAPLLLAWLVFQPALLEGQEQAQVLTTKNIRARKLAKNWQGQLVELTLTDGSRVRGKFLGADFYQFTLDMGDKEQGYLIDVVTSVTFKPGLAEAVLNVATGLLASGLALGIVSLTTPDTPTGRQAAAGAIGGAVGLWAGYKTFYQAVVIELEE